MPATRTDLLDRYLHAVKFWLPKAQQQDIIAELAEDLHSQIEEREAALGHPLGVDDLAALLRKRGAPMKVASGYVPEQRLLHPAMVPLYRLVLKIVLLWVLAPLFAIVFIGPLFTSAHPGEVMLRFWTEAWRTGFMVVGIITTVFLLLDRYHFKIQGMDHWDPRKLPRVPASRETSSRWDHLAGFIFGTLAAACWIYFMWQRSEFSFPPGPRIILGPVWTYVNWAVVGFALAGASIDLLSFRFPAWTRVRSCFRLGLDACGVVVMAALLRVDNWVEIANSNLSAADQAKVMTGVNDSIRILLIITALGTIWDAIQEVRRLMRARSAKPAPLLTTS